MAQTDRNREGTGLSESSLQMKDKPSSGNHEAPRELLSWELLSWERRQKPVDDRCPLSHSIRKIDQVVAVPRHRRQQVVGCAPAAGAEGRGHLSGKVGAEEAVFAA